MSPRWAPGLMPMLVVTQVFGQLRLWLFIRAGIGYAEIKAKPPLKGASCQMNHELLIALALKKPGTSLRYPFEPDLPVLYVGSKMFALLGHQSGVPSVNLKADPDTIWLMRQTYPDTVLPGYHMNKRHWNTVILNGKLADEELENMLEESYQLVRRNLSKAEKEAIWGPGQ